jgi:DNA repair exonuclease SbcCD ATPase subunit
VSSVKRILLDRIQIRNFKGICDRTIELDGKNADIRGDNATGKTTIYDALTWCLFGKDSRGRSDFEIKPLGQDGDVLDHAAVTSVSAVLVVDGKQVELSRCFREKWSMKRGGSETFDGHTTEFSINGVPIQKKGFDAAVSDLVPEDVFRMLTDVNAFCEKLSWQKRREILFDVFTLEPDLVLMERDEKFSSLADAIDGMTLDDFKRLLQSKRKELTGARDSLPARIDEVTRSVRGLEGRDYVLLHSQRAELDMKLRQLDAEISKAENGSLLASLKNDQDAAKLALATLRAENREFRARQTGDGRGSIETMLRGVRQQIKRYEDLIALDNQLIKWNGEKLKALRREWMDIDRSTYDGDIICPTCGQALPPEQIERAKKRFETEKEARKQTLVIDSNGVKELSNQAEDRIKELYTSLQDAKIEEKDCLTKLERLSPNLVMDMPDFCEREVELSGALDAAAERYVKAYQDTASVVAAKKDEKSRVLAEIKAVDGQLAGESLLVTARQRLAQLMSQKQSTASEIGRVDDLLGLCDEFARFKVSSIEDGVNDTFETVKFRLFKEQVNGGIAECCDVMVDGVPYGSLNSAARTNAGIDVIRTLSRFYGVSVPLFVDNAESVVLLADAGTQTVRLVVDGGRKELEINVA